MSHIDLIEADSQDQQITDLSALRRACERVGLEFRENKTHFTSWVSDQKRTAGDYPPPKGYSTQDLVDGGCLHAIGIPGCETKRDGSHYEIGVVASKKFPGTMSLMYDHFLGKLDAKAGKGLENLHMYYHAEAARIEATKQGYQYSEQTLADGTLQVELDMTVKLGY